MYWKQHFMTTETFYVVSITWTCCFDCCYFTCNALHELICVLKQHHLNEERFQTIFSNYFCVVIKVFIIIISSNYYLKKVIIFKSFSTYQGKPNACFINTLLSVKDQWKDKTVRKPAKGLMRVENLNVGRYKIIKKA